MMNKQNHVDYQWFVVRTRQGNERDVCDLIDREKANYGNILETFCPTTSVRALRGGKVGKATMFDGFAFVLATQSALSSLLREKCPKAYIGYVHKRHDADGGWALYVIPEAQMRAFKDFNENYADKVVVLERPYADYAFNTKTNEPNELVCVIDGPLAGREGYVCRFNRGRGLVFEVQDVLPGRRLAVVYPNAYDLHVVRLHNAEGDRLSMDTEKPRAADLLVGLLQACGYDDRAREKFYEIMDTLAAKLSLVELRKSLTKKGDRPLSERLARLTNGEAELIINLARYERDNPGYVRENWPQVALRPFLTPTPGIEWRDGEERLELQHAGFTEIIRKADITEELYFPSRRKCETVTTTYYAHIGVMPSPREGSGYTLFANWGGFLGQYFLTAGKANEKLVEGGFSVGREIKGQAGGDEGDRKEKVIASFRMFAPTLYRVLTERDSRVRAVKGLKAGETALDALALTTTDLAEGTDELLHTGLDICKEINSTNRLAIWRRYLRSVWLHQ